MHESLRCPACDGALPELPALHGCDRLHGLPGAFAVLVCAACGSGLTTPVLGAGELGGLYPPGYGAYGLPAQPLLRAAATALFRLRYRRALRQLPLSVLRERKPGRLLDVGSGRGDLGVVAAELGWDVTGLEPSAEAARAARERGVATVVGTLDGAALDPPYDVVVFQHSLEHVADPLGAVQRVGELLCPRGSVLVTVPNFGSWQAERFQAAWFHLDLPRHRSHFTPAGLELLLERAGFDGVRTATSTSADGLPMSVEYRVLGQSRHGPARYAEIGAVVALTPVTALVGSVARDGDILHAVASTP